MISYLHKFRDHANANRARKFSQYILPQVENGDVILDFGCGSLQVAENILQKKQVQIHGIDILPSDHPSIPFTLYDGKRIPFPDNHFDVTYANFVFHHIPDSQHLIQECFRVTKKRLIILEDVYHHQYQNILNKMFDYGNKLTEWDMHMALNFKHEEEWKKVLSNQYAQTVETYPITPYFWKPTIHRQFVVNLAK